MASIPPDALDLFDKRTFAHVATLLPDGAPHATPVWIDYDEDADLVVVNTERGRRKEKNVRSDSRVAISMTDPEDPYRLLSMTGSVVDVTTDGAREHADKLAKRYMDIEEYPSEIQTERVLLLIEPDNVIYSGR